ncbi:MAG TPA: Vms1/Ankzf1 family peptidyl-tRNA hydrolase [Gaiellaceae bacterium]|nr:Vms1/Ankzf1 family peptidyl-tRNA hydrolase [Gaiellaceae bacterium]
MAATVTWEVLRDLATFRAEQGCAISLYLDLDPSESPTAEAVDTRSNALLDAVGRWESANQSELTRGQREGMRADLDRLRAFFEDEFSREGSHGFAVFCDGLDGAWHTLALSDRVPDLSLVDSEFYLAPLVPLVGRDDGVLVAFVGRERGDLYRLRAGRLEETVEQHDDTPGRHDQGGWSQARYQRHIDKLVQDHLRDVAELLDRQVRRLRGARVVLVASEETRAELEEELSHEVRNALIGWTSADAHAGTSELYEAVEPLVERWREEQESELAERWQEAAGRNGRAAAGWPQTLEAASDGRVEVLLYEEGADRHAWRCPKCGRLSADPGPCPLDGTGMEENDHGLDLAVHRTLANGGKVSALRSRHDLEPVEGIGALLRY